MVSQAKKAGITDEQTLGTVLVTLAGSTFFVGLLIVLVGESLLYLQQCTSLLTISSSACCVRMHRCSKMDICQAIFVGALQGSYSWRPLCNTFRFPSLAAVSRLQRWICRLQVSRHGSADSGLFPAHQLLYVVQIWAMWDTLWRHRGRPWQQVHSPDRMHIQRLAAAHDHHGQQRTLTGDSPCCRQELRVANQLGTACVSGCVHEAHACSRRCLPPLAGA